MIGSLWTLMITNIFIARTAWYKGPAWFATLDACLSELPFKLLQLDKFHRWFRWFSALLFIKYIKCTVSKPSPTIHHHCKFVKPTTSHSDNGQVCSVPRPCQILMWPPMKNSLPLWVTLREMNQPPNFWGYLAGPKSPCHQQSFGRLLRLKACSSCEFCNSSSNLSLGPVGSDQDWWGSQANIWGQWRHKYIGHISGGDEEIYRTQIYPRISGGDEKKNYRTHEQMKWQRKVVVRTSQTGMKLPKSAVETCVFSCNFCLSDQYLFNLQRSGGSKIFETCDGLHCWKMPSVHFFGLGT